MERRYYKTIVPVEVLSEHPIEDPIDLAELAYDSCHGGLSVRTLDLIQTELTAQEAAEALMEQGSSPDFFDLDEDGTYIGDDDEN